MPAWKPDSWRGKPVLQVPKYPDAAALEAVERDLRNFPPLVFVKEVSDLKAKLGGVAAGESFLLQGGELHQPVGRLVACARLGRRL